MKTFTFDGPNGQTRTIEGPDDATPEQAQEQFGRLLAEERAARASAGQADMQRMADPTAGMGAGEKLLVGAGAAFDRAKRGVTGLFGADNTKGKEDAEAYQAHHPGGWATAGEIGADVAMSALPLRYAKVGGLIKSAAKLGKYAPLVADAAYNAGYNALTSPEDRGKAAAVGAGGAVAGRVLNRAVSGLVKPKAEAQVLMDQGVRLTPGQAGEGAMGSAARGYEHFLEATPGMGGVLTKAKDRGLRDWNDLLGVGTEDIGHAMPPSILKVSRGAQENLKDITESLAEDVAPNVRQQFLRTTGKISGNLAEGMQSAHYKEAVIDELAKATDLAKRNGNDSLYKAYKEFGEYLNTAIQDTTNIRGLADDLDKLGEQARTGLVLKRAATIPGEPIRPEALARAAKGNPELLEKARLGAKVFGDGPSDFQKAFNRAGRFVVPTAGSFAHVATGGKLLLPMMASLPGATERGSRFILGQNGWQRWLAQHPEMTVQLLRGSATNMAEGE